MRRREFITALAGATIGRSAAAAAQQTEQRRIGVLMQITESDLEAKARVRALIQGLRELNWIEGRDFRLEFRGIGEASARAAAMVSELLETKPEVVLAVTGRLILELQKQTKTTPIVFVNFSSPIEAGVVTNLLHPGGNTTGFTGSMPSMGGKWIELLKEAAPAVDRVLVLMNPEALGNAGFLQAIEASARPLDVRVSASTVPNRLEMEREINAFAAQQNCGLIAMPGGPITVERKRVIELALQHRLPAIYGFKYYAAEGGLMSYGADVLDVWRRSASYVDRILKGEKPGDLPVQAPTKFELAINVKTASALGLTIPPMLLARANDLID